MNESQYQSKLVKKLETIFPGCMVIRLHQTTQGLPDLILLWQNYWAMLEIKRSAAADRQPNQDYYIHQLNEMSFAAYIYPENEWEVLSALQQAFKPPRRARVFKS